MFTRYYFVLNAAAKAEILQSDAKIAQTVCLLTV